MPSEHPAWFEKSFELSFVANALGLTELLFLLLLLGALFCHTLLLMSVLDVLEDLVLFDFGFEYFLLCFGSI